MSSMRFDIGRVSHCWVIVPRLDRGWPLWTSIGVFSHATLPHEGGGVAIDVNVKVSHGLFAPHPKKPLTTAHKGKLISVSIVLYFD